MNRRDWTKRSGLVLACAALAAACGKSPAPEAVAVDPALDAYVLDSVPTDIENRTFIDFGGKLHLIGYALEPKRVAGPGAKLKLKLYWQKVGPLEPGWNLFTHVLDDRGTQRKNADNDGPLRRLTTGADGKPTQALGPSRWQTGKVYVDEQEIDLPTELRTREVTIVVGAWTDRGAAQKNLSSHRLSVISGPSDGRNRGIVAHLKTGLKPSAIPVEPKT
jgi:hypothetical protein